VPLHHPVAERNALDHLVADLRDVLRQAAKRLQIVGLGLRRIGEVVPHENVVGIQRGNSGHVLLLDPFEQLLRDFDRDVRHGLSLSC
jgi:hypothetical protein